MSNDINDIDDLIGKVLAGEATPEERRRLDAWSAIHPDNKKYVDQIREIHQRAVIPQTELDFDTDAAWKKMKARLNGQVESIASNRGASSLWPVLRIAAGLLLLLTVGIFAYRQFNQPVQSFALVADSVALQNKLPDGTTAFLNKRSSITYEYSSRQKVRKVKLKGESYFDVKHEEEKPFIIEAEEVLIRDIGTTFNVKAWPESDTVEVFVETGLVQIYTMQDAGIGLQVGETGIYSRSNKVFSRLEKSDANVLAYQTGELSFVNTDLKSVVEKINEVYDSQIRLENPALETCRLTASFHHDTLDTVVDVIAETMKLSVERKGKEIILNGKGCN